MAKNIFDPSFTPKKRYSAPAPRFARIMIVILGLLLMGGVIVAIVNANSSSLDWTDEEALAQIENYRQQDMIDLNQYLIDRGYRAFGEPDAYNYIQNNSGVFTFRDTKPKFMSVTARATPANLAPGSARFISAALDGFMKKLSHT